MKLSAQEGQPGAKQHPHRAILKGSQPLGSLEAEKNKRASEIISEKKYRQPPDRNKFTSIPDAMDIVLAKTNAKNRSDVSTSSEIW